MAAFRLGALAEADIVSLLARTEDRFGENARRRHEILLMTGPRDITSDPGRLGSAVRLDLGPLVCSITFTTAGIGRAPSGVSSDSRAIYCFTGRWFPAPSVSAASSTTPWKSSGIYRVITAVAEACYRAFALASDRVAPDRAARAAAMNSSRSPSSTASGLPFSTPVRRSFTNWYGART
jgi:hypothetical protein